MHTSITCPIDYCLQEVMSLVGTGQGIAQVLGLVNSVHQGVHHSVKYDQRKGSPR